MVSQRFDGASTRSYFPTSTGFALSFSAASSPHFRARPTRSDACTYSQPRPIGATSLAARVWKSLKSGATAVAAKSGQLRMSVWSITDPSVLANCRSCLTKKSTELTNRTPSTFIASAFALSSTSTFCSSGTSNGSTV